MSKPRKGAYIASDKELLQAIDKVERRLLSKQTVSARKNDLYLSFYLRGEARKRVKP